VIASKEFQTAAAGRARIYAVLAALCSAPPSREMTKLICAGGMVQEGNNPWSAAANALTKVFRQAAAEGLPDGEPAAEYTRLFVLPSGVVPHESFYVDENRRVGGRVTIGVQRYYEAAAAQLTGACLDLPDHIGIELEFMKFLCDIEEQFWREPNIEGLKKCLDFQNSFLADHLLRWHLPLCEKVLEETKLDLYRALARLIIEFLDAERTFVPELTEEISEWRKTCACKS
jgi:TorA maturation chaperone TorD